jgi:uncharacterized protein involved in outer membrane biogenesis
MKWVTRILIGLAALVVVLLVVVMFFMGAVIKSGVETAGPKVLGVPVQLDSARFYPLRGKIALGGLVIGNPEGYKAPSAFKLGRFRADVSVGSLFTDTIVVREILIEGPEITFEGSLKGSNISALMKGIEERTGGKTPREEKPAKASDPGKPAKKVIIDSFVFRGGRVNLSAGLMGGKAVPLPLPPIELSGIGRDKGGASPTEAATQIMGAIMRAVTGVVLKSAEILGKGAAALGDIAMQGAVDAALKGAGAAGAAGEGVLKGAEAAGAGLLKGAEEVGKLGEGAGSALGKVGEGAGAVVGEGGKAAAEALGGAAEGASKLLGGMGGLLKKKDPVAEPAETE